MICIPSYAARNRILPKKLSRNFRTFKFLNQTWRSQLPAVAVVAVDVLTQTVTVPCNLGLTNLNLTETHSRIPFVKFASNPATRPFAVGTVTVLHTTKTLRKRRCSPLLNQPNLPLDISIAERPHISRLILLNFNPLHLIPVLSTSPLATVLKCQFVTPVEAFYLLQQVI